ncbi:MAG TPA: FG-GAP-like repeat-containing protein [Candidatus Cybelea sp.]|jgi:type II secretory pathway component GspD/PulD (secretin)|nr:FG-GAP-like repeat-containing protein [Candidatus Cybelea sp.]
MTVSPHFRQVVSLLLTLLLCCAESGAQSSAPAQSSPPETAPNEAQLQMAPRPNPKYAKKLSELADKELADGRFDEALNYYQQAARYAPQDTALIERIASMRSKLVQDHVDAAERDALAGHADVATEELAKALLIDPGNTIVAERLKQMNEMKDEPLAKPDRRIEGFPELKPLSPKQDLNLRGDSKTVYEQLGQLFGIKVVFDPELAARTVRLHADNVDFTTALKILSAETGTFSRPLTSTLLFVAQDTLEKRRQYAAEAEQTFVLPESVGTEEMTELVRVLREMTGSTRVQLDSQSRALSIRDTPERLMLAGEIIRQAEKSRGEILLEIEILEVDRNKAFTLGLLPPSSAELISLTPSLISQLQQAQNLSTLITLLASIFGSGSSSSTAGSSLNLSSLIPPLTVVGGGKTTFLLTLPAIAAQFSDALSLVHSGRQVLLRAQDGKPASFFVGDRYPITLSLLSGSLGTSTAATSVGGVSNSILPSTSYNVGIGPVALTAADFRNIGQLDLAVVNEIDDTLTILENQSAGTFLQAGLPISLGAARTVAPVIAPSIASAVLTTSGFHDLLVTDPVDNTVQVLLSNGDDTFKQAPGSPIAMGKQPSSIVLGDFNGDGIQDFAVTNFTDNTLSLFLGNGDGTFKQATSSPFAMPATATGPIAMTSADFNSDGNLDLAIVNQTTNNVTILLGNGNATFNLATGSPFAVGTFPVAIATGDLNNDSHPDLVVVNQSDGTVSVLLGNGDGTFTAATNSPLATGQSPTAVTVTDFNGDGIPDFAVTDPETDSVSVFLGVGQGLFAPAFQLPVGSNPTAILSASLSGASLPDVAVTDDPPGATGQVTVILSPASLFSSSGAAGITQQPYPGAQYEDLGVKIKATPTIHPNEEVTLQLEFEIRALAGSSINGIPIITNRTLSQTVRIREDEPTIIGGLLDNEETRTITGLPGFANLPGAAGYFFGQRNTTAQDTEMVILITPHKLRLQDRVSRSIYVGRDTSAGRGSTAVPLPSQRQP